MYIDSPTQRFFFERTSSTQRSATPLAQQSSVPFGIWKASHCEYYKDGALLPAKRCNLKLEMKLSILPEKFVFEIEGKAPRVVSNPAYKEFPKWVEIQTGSSSDRIHTSEKDFISTFMNTPTPDVSAKVYFTKIESIGTATQSSGALQVPATPATNDSSGFVPVGMQAASGKDLSFLKKALKITDNVKMVVGRADFNGDQQDDYLVVLQSSLYCGSGGCSTFLVLGGKQPTAYETNLTYIENQFAVSTNMHKGIKNVVYMMDGKPVLGEKRGTPLYGKVLEYEFERAMK